jgi:DNA polymerase V
MRGKLFALVDCNNFYASCERAFNASIQKKPVVVLSNNDGCIVARSAESKKLGLKMGQPIFTCEKIIREHQVQVFSSNYSLYADLSARVMKVLEQFTPTLEVYSIDEAWLDVADYAGENLTELGKTIKERVFQYTGIPVTVAIAPTKCLTKVAAERAKKDPAFQGVLDITGYDREALDSLLAQVAIEDVWGIGSKYALFLQNHGLRNAKALKDADQKWIRRFLTVVGERIVLELRGTSCFPLETQRAPKKTIVRAKSFGREVTELAEVAEALATYTARAAETLREQESVAGTLSVFLQTTTFNPNIPRYSNSFTLSLPFPTAFTPALLYHALQGLNAIYRTGYRYKKVGVQLGKITPNAVQPDLFGDHTLDERSRQDRLMFIVDALNRIYGKDTLFFAMQGVTRPWSLRRLHLSQRFTTSWDELLTI